MEVCIVNSKNCGLCVSIPMYMYTYNVHVLYTCTQSSPQHGSTALHCATVIVVMTFDPFFFGNWG